MASWTDDDLGIQPNERPAMRDAIRLARGAQRRKPTPDDAPDISTFPMSRAARAALQISRNKAKRERKMTW